MFETVDVPAGAGAYAEAFAADSFLTMPANALVNVGYLVVGGYWLFRAFRAPVLLRADRLFFVAFASLAILYGPVQFVRIVTQHRTAGIADQWLTLPFFALVIAWNLRLQARAAVVGPLMFGSICSYLLAVWLPFGFELALVLHIVGAVFASVPTLRLAGRPGVAPFVLAVICCALFVGLKKADFALYELGLTRLTGHFWSKVADFLQIHFAAAFFLTAEPRPWPLRTSSSPVPAPRG